MRECFSVRYVGLATQGSKEEATRRDAASRGVCCRTSGVAQRELVAARHFKNCWASPSQLTKKLQFLPLQVHHDLAKYHELGRFTLDDNDIDLESAFYHEQQAASLGVMEAIRCMASIYLGMPREILVNYEVEVSFCSLFQDQARFILSIGAVVKTPTTNRDAKQIEVDFFFDQDTELNRSRGIDYMYTAAKAGCRSAMIHMARAFETGIGLGFGRYVNSAEVYQGGATFQQEENENVIFPSCCVKELFSLHN